MVAEKTLFILNKLKYSPKHFFAAATLFILIMFFAKADPFGFTSFSPSPDEIKGFSLDKTTFYDDPALEHLTFARDPALIAEAARIQRMIAIRKNDFDEIRINSDYNGFSSGEQRRISLTFKLKNGKTVSRSFVIDGGDIEESFKKLSLEEEVILNSYPGLKAPEIISCAEVHFYHGNGREYIVKVSDPEQLKSFAEEVKNGLLGKTPLTNDSSVNILLIGDNGESTSVYLPNFGTSLNWLLFNGYLFKASNAQAGAMHGNGESHCLHHEGIPT
jgi:hypothetical protein